MLSSQSLPKFLDCLVQLLSNLGELIKDGKEKLPGRYCKISHAKKITRFRLDKCEVTSARFFCRNR